MPLFDFACPNHHHREVFAHKVENAAADACEMCGEAMERQLSMGRGLTYFGSGGKGKWIYNLGDEPVFIESTAQHERIMKERGVTWAPARRGMKGCW